MSKLTIHKVNSGNSAKIDRRVVKAYSCVKKNIEQALQRPQLSNSPNFKTPSSTGQGLLFLIK